MRVYRVYIKQGFERNRCLKCNKSIQRGQQYTIETTSPKAQQDLKYTTKYRLQHYPSCDNPGMWESK